VNGDQHAIAASSPQGQYSFSNWSDGGAQSHTVTASPSTTSYIANFGAISHATDVSSQVSITQAGFTRNHFTGLWSATMTVKNTSGSAINGPIQVVLTNLSSNATMANNTGMHNGSPYITVLTTTGALAAGGSVSVPIQFTNPSNGFITYTPVTYSGAF